MLEPNGRRGRSSLILGTLFGLIGLPLGAIVPATKPALRLDGAMGISRLSPNGRYIAFTNPDGLELRILDRLSRAVFSVSEQKIGPAFVWSPDGTHLFYRSLSKNRDAQLTTEVATYDVFSHSSKIMASFNKTLTGYLTLNQKGDAILIMDEDNIHSHRLSTSPNQKVKASDPTGWLVGPRGVAWLETKTLTKTDALPSQHVAWQGDEILNYDVSPKGDLIALATKDGRIIVASKVSDAVVVGEGTDPRWHPKSNLLSFSAAKKTGAKTTDHDLYLYDWQLKKGKFLTRSAGQDERSALWMLDGTSLLFTEAGSTDLYELSLKDTK